MWSKPLLCRFRQPGKVPKTQALQGFEAFRLTLSRIQPRHPKCRALPVEPHPVIHFSVIIPRRGRKSKIFCLWSFMWSKPLLCRFLQSGEIPKMQVSQGFAAFCHDLTRTRDPNLGKVVLYQLSYFRSFSYYLGAFL